MRYISGGRREQGVREDREVKSPSKPQKITSLPGVGSNLLVDLPAKLKVKLVRENEEDNSAGSEDGNTGGHVGHELVEDVLVIRDVVLGDPEIRQGLLNLEVLKDREGHHAGAEHHMSKHLNGVLVPELQKE